MPKSFSLLLWAAPVLLAGCIQPYEPKVSSRETNLLVVDGFINTAGVTTIKLSHAVTVGSKNAPPAETRATLFIEEEGGTRYALREGQAGTYSSAPLQLLPGRQVRLRLTTAKGQEYASDYTTARITPPIDSVSWRPERDRLRIYVNTHDDTNQNRYFRWNYEETWEFTSLLPSSVEYRNRALELRTTEIYRCWRTEAAENILLGNSTRLSRNVIAEQPVLTIFDTSPKMRYRYSILVRQYALGPEENDYWEALRKNTEQLGTIFSPMPTQLTGNVHNLTNPAEKVLGFVGAQSVTEKRLFIARQQLPLDWPYVTGYEGCGVDTIPRKGDPAPPSPEEIVAFFGRGEYIPITYEIQKRRYWYSTTECMDCRLRGTTTKPSFWP